MKPGTASDRIACASFARTQRAKYPVTGYSRRQWNQFVLSATMNRLEKMMAVRRAYKAAVIDSRFKPADALHCSIDFTAEKLRLACTGLVAMGDGK